MKEIARALKHKIKRGGGGVEKKVKTLERSGYGVCNAFAFSSDMFLSGVPSPTVTDTCLFVSVSDNNVCILCLVSKIAFDKLFRLHC